MIKPGCNTKGRMKNKKPLLLRRHAEWGRKSNNTNPKQYGKKEQKRNKENKETRQKNCL